MTELTQVTEHRPGGCDLCDAYQTVGPCTAGLWLIVVHHDAWCPQIAPQPDDVA